MTPIRPRNQLEYDLEHKSDILVVRLRGSADHDQTAVLERCAKDIQAQLKQLVVLDLSELTYIASAGLGALISLHHAIKAQEGRLRLVRLTEAVREVFRAMHLDTVFWIDADTEQAVSCQLSAISRRRSQTYSADR
jgi:anti-sigma B factor antagonist